MEHERGEATTTVLAVPIAMFLVFVVIQAALLFHARSIVDAAAQTGAQSARGESGTEETARAAAQSVMEASAGSLLSDVDIAIQANPARLSVPVHASVKSLIPGFAPRIASTAAGPREAFTPQNRR